MCAPGKNHQIMFRWWSVLPRNRACLIVFLGALAALSVQTSSAQPPIGAGACKCRANSQNYVEGQTTCLSLNGRNDTYRCAKVQNVTSWKKIIDGCPQS
jgi:hypothetical protein